MLEITIPENGEKSLHFQIDLLIIFVIKKWKLFNLQARSKDKQMKNLLKITWSNLKLH